MKEFIKKIFKPVTPKRHFLGSLPKRKEEQKLYFQELYRDKGVYSIIQTIVLNMSGSRSLLRARVFLNAANSLKLLPTVKLDDIHLLGNLAFVSDKSEEIRRGYAWLALQSENYGKALEQALIIKQCDSNINPSWDKIYSIAIEKINALGREHVNLNNINEQQDLSGYKWLEAIRLPSDTDKRLLVFSEVLEINGTDGLRFYIENQKGSPRFLAGLYILAAKKMALDKDMQAAKVFLQEAFDKDTSESSLRGMYWVYKRMGDKEGCEKVLQKFEMLSAKNNSKIIQESISKLIKDFNDSFNLTDILQHIPDHATEEGYDPIAEKIAYVVHNSLPYSSGGYATRTHGLFKGLLNHGLDIQVVTRPGYPLDIVKNLKEKDIERIDTIGGGLYHRVNEPLRNKLSQKDYLLQAADAMTEMLKTIRPSLVISASNYTTAFPALVAARRLGIPFIYEVRGFWEITKLSREPEFEHHADFAIQKSLESNITKHADHIFTLTIGMYKELLNRGVMKDKVTIIPNSCDPGSFIVREKDLTLLNKLGIPKEVPVIGYIGTLVSYEGLDDLVKACGLLKKKGYEFRLLIVGNENASGVGAGSITKEIQELARLNGFFEWLIMPGRVPYNQVDSYYSLIDIAPFPRKPWPICEIVSPMKPLEALATGKAVIVSSVDALKEMIVDGQTGLIFEKGSIEDFSCKIESLIKNIDFCKTLGSNGREWVEEVRTWQHTSLLAKNIIIKFLMNTKN